MTNPTRPIFGTTGIYDLIYAEVDKHTPGPWTAQIGYETHYGACRIYAGDRHPNDGMVAWATDQSGATLDARRTSCLGDTRQVGQIQANARLIAAAPEMLGALKLAATILEGAIHPALRRPDDGLAQIQAVIAKAEAWA